MDPVSEQFGARLIRVIKNVKRRTGDGGVKTIKQSFHVRKASPGDQYSAIKQRDVGSMGDGIKKAKLKIPNLGIGDAGAEAQVNPESPNEIPRRIEVRYYDIAWDVGESQEKDRDPIPAAVRNRFDANNRHARARSPLPFNSAVHGVTPTDPVLWGMDEPSVLSKMRSGRITRLGLLGSDTGLLRAKLEVIDGTTVYTYMALESLVDPYVYLLWGDFYGFEKGNGDISKRAAASYEVAKAAGFDDLVPPTVMRTDRDGDVDPILPPSLLERKTLHAEAIAKRTGEHPDTIRKQLSGFSWMQLVRGETNGIEGEKWFQDIFQRDGEVERKDALNHVWENMPGGRRTALLRTAMLDFILWIGDRHWGDMLFCSDDRHPVHLVANELSCPSPRVIGRRVLDAGGDVQFVGGEVNPKVIVPMLWSEPLLMLATRGSDAELDDVEKIGIYVVHRMKGNRAYEMARSLTEYGLSPLSVAGVLSRIWVLGTHSKEIARNPFFMAQYYASMVSGEARPEMKGVVDYVNEAMKRLLIRNFDFADAMKSSDEDEEEGVGDPSQPGSDNEEA